MSTYKKSEKIPSYKPNNSGIQKYNEELTSFAVEDKDSFELSKNIINDLKLNSAKGGSFGQLKNLDKIPESNKKIPKFLATKLKNKMYKAVEDNDILKVKKLNKDVDKLVGVLSMFQNNDKKLKEALDKPSGSPGALNVGLMADNVNLLQYMSDFNLNGDKNFDLDIDDNDEITLSIPNQKPLYITQLTNYGMNSNANSQQFVPVLGDPDKLIYQTMDNAGPTPVVEEVLSNMDIPMDAKGDEDLEIPFESKADIQKHLVKYPHANMLNEKNVSQSLWPHATQMAVSVLNNIGQKDEEADVFENEVLGIFGKYQSFIGDNYNLVKEYEKTGQKAFGNYIGSDGNIDQQNSELVNFQRDLLSWSWNYGYYNKNVSPYIKEEKAVKQGESKEGSDIEGAKTSPLSNSMFSSEEKVKTI